MRGHTAELVVGAFEGASGDAVVILGQDSAVVGGQGLVQAQGLLQPRMLVPGRVEVLKVFEQGSSGCP